MEPEIVLTRRRLPERETFVIDGQGYEVRCELVAQTGIGIWPFRVYTYQLDFSDINRGYFTAFIRNRGKPPEVKTSDGRVLQLKYK